ncbi:MAG TPA: hypothetical protein VHW60_17120 [Caulobacteraceae bacterium]|nr:hypothetical protein [Caulobacteraceae bacterium]
MSRTFVPVLAAAAAVCAASGPAFALSVVTHLGDTLTASPLRYAGACPGVITFTGVVNVSGRFQPGSSVEIGYQFTRSDGATGQNQFFSVDHAGPHAITETWTLGGPPLPVYSGWERFKTWPTDSAQGGGHVTAVSNMAHFGLRCAAQPQRPPRRPG